MSSIDVEDNNVAVALLGLAVAADDPFSDNNLNKNAAGTNQDSDKSTAVGDDQTANGSVNDTDDNDGAINSGGSVFSDDGDVANNSSKVDSDRNNDAVSGSNFSAADGDVKRNDWNSSSNVGNSTTDGDIKDQDDTVSGSNFSAADGDVKYNDNNGDGNFRATDKADVKDNDENLNSGSNWDNDNSEGNNRDNWSESKDGSFRDLDDLLDFDNADFSDQEGFFAPIVNYAHLEGGGQMVNNNQQAQLNNEDLKADVEYGGWDNKVDADGGDGGKGEGDGGKADDGGDGGRGGSLDLAGYDPVTAKKMADDCEKDDYAPKCPDPCCDDGTWTGGTGGSGGSSSGGSGDGTGGSGGNGGYGFQINFGAVSANNSGSNDGGNAEDGSSSGNDSVTAQINPSNIWSNYAVVGAGSINQDFSVLAGDFDLAP